MRTRSTGTASSQCDQTGGTVVCADNGITTDGALNCCRNAGGACTAANNSASCCGGLHCLNGICQEGGWPYLAVAAGQDRGDRSPGPRDLASFPSTGDRWARRQALVDDGRGVAED